MASSASLVTPVYAPVIIGGLPGDILVGHGTHEAKEVAEILKSANIAHCMVGVSALMYYGAGRVRQDWEICVPTDELEEASTVFKLEPHSSRYEAFLPQEPVPSSLRHTFPRFKKRGVAFFFTLYPSEDCHFACKPSNIEYSRNNLPYPKLHIFAQSLLDTNDLVDLQDLVDGMDLSEEWGEQHLDLEGTNDVEWAERKNEKIRASVPVTDTSCMLEVFGAAFNKRETWKEIVGRKSHRIGVELPKEYFATRFRGKNMGDPRSEDRDCV